MATEYRTYYSERGMPLLYVHEPDTIPVVTLENYTKWYTLHTVNPDGSVTKIDGRILSEVMDKYHDAAWTDHRFSPRFIYRLAQHLGADVDERAIECALGRWMLEGDYAHASHHEPDDWDDHIESVRK